jgi:hypothetical protein
MAKTFPEVAIGIRHWFRRHNMMPRDDEPPVKITIEVPTPQIAVAVLRQLRGELEIGAHDPMQTPGFDRPFQLIGMMFEFKIRDAQPMPGGYVLWPFKSFADAS